MTKKKKASKKEVLAWKDRRGVRFIEKNKAVIEWAQHKDPKRNNKIYARTQDLSIGGAKILTDINFPVDTVFMITLTLTRSRKIIKVAAMVRWVNPVNGGDSYEVGLKFGHYSPNYTSVLIRHLFGKDYPQDVALEMAQEERNSVQPAAS
ncbi:MAG: PilZ domain-containing protein [Candidatus Aminicenantes bacterium]|nr:PilZ domain-containing protein [Candidatus Aminicenantes bacterium]